MWSDIVTILTSKEDEVLSKSYRTKMPLEWNFFQNDKFERYKASGIQSPPYLEINVFGPVKR